MELLTPFTEEVHLGILDDPHIPDATVLTELVTVCPSCCGLNTLHHRSETVFCTDCAWSPGDATVVA